MSKVPSYLRRLAVEGGGDPEAVRNELLLCLVDVLEQQNAILDDTIWDELRVISEAQGRQIEALEVLVSTLAPAENGEQPPLRMISEALWNPRSELLTALRFIGNNA
jgi:hypothetical protein